MPEEIQSCFQIVRVSDVWDSIMEGRKRWTEEKRVGCVSFDEEYQAIAFHFDTTGENYRYWLHISRFGEPKQQMQWINHLRHKSWFTREVMNDFLDVLEYMGLLPDGLD